GRRAASSGATNRPNRHPKALILTTHIKKQGERHQPLPHPHSLPDNHPSHAEPNRRRSVSWPAGPQARFQPPIYSQPPTPSRLTPHAPRPTPSPLPPNPLVIVDRVNRAPIPADEIHVRLQHLRQITVIVHLHDDEARPAPGQAVIALEPLRVIRP